MPGADRSETEGTGPSEGAVGALAGRVGRVIDLTGVSRVYGSGEGRSTRSRERRPAEALVEAASRTDLLVVGSRGAGGLRGLGSVSERVAHRAASSVLVVRP